MTLRPAKRPSYLLAACMALTAGCATDLDAVRLGSSAAPPIAGAPYNLSFTQYEVTVTRRVGACSTPNPSGGPDIAGLKIAFDAKISSKEVPDPKRHYVIDLQSLQSAWKVSSIVVEYHENGTLKSINASADDRSAQAISAIVTSIGKIVVAGAGAAGVGSGCNQDTQETLDKVKAQESEIRKLTARQERMTKQLEAMRTSAAALGDAWSATERQLFSDQIALVHKESTELADKQEELSQLLRKISNVEKFTWPLDGSTTESPGTLIPLLSEKQLDSWGSVGVDEAELKAFQAKTGVYAKLTSAIDYGKDPCLPGCKDDGVRGVKYRMPVMGTLLLCSAPACAKGDVIATSSGPISQLGTVFSLPLHSPMFSKKVVEATFNDAGKPLKLGVRSETATAEVAASAFGGMLDTALSVRDKTVTTELERMQQKTAFLKAQAELAAAEKALIPASNSDTVAATNAFTTDTALLNAHLANIQAQLALDAALKQLSQD